MLTQSRGMLQGWIPQSEEVHRLPGSARGNRAVGIGSSNNPEDPDYDPNAFDENGNYIADQAPRRRSRPTYRGPIRDSTRARLARSSGDQDATARAAAAAQEAARQEAAHRQQLINIENQRLELQAREADRQRRQAIIDAEIADRTREREIQERERARVIREEGAQRERERQEQLVARQKQIEEEAAQRAAQADAQARAPRWVRGRPQLVNPRDPSGSEVVELPDGSRVTKRQALQNGWYQTTNPQDQGSDPSNLSQVETVYVKADPANDAAVRQAIAAAGGQIKAAYRGTYQVQTPLGAIGALQNIPGAEVRLGKGANLSQWMDPTKTGSGTPGIQAPVKNTPGGGTAAQSSGWTPPAFSEGAGPESTLTGQGTTGYYEGNPNTPIEDSFRPIDAVTAGGGGGGGGGSVGGQMGGTGGWGDYSPITNAPPIPEWNDWNNMTEFEKASFRTLVEASGPWEEYANAMRQEWGKAGVFSTPQTTQLSAATYKPRDVLNRSMTAEVFGEKPTDYWQGQQKQWGQSKAAGTSIRARGSALSDTNRSLALGR